LARQRRTGTPPDAAAWRRAYPMLRLGRSRSLFVPDPWGRNESGHDRSHHLRNQRRHQYARDGLISMPGLQRAHPLRAQARTKVLHPVLDTADPPRHDRRIRRMPHLPRDIQAERSRASVTAVLARVRAARALLAGGLQLAFVGVPAVL